MEYTALEKFMRTMGLKYSIEIDRHGISHGIKWVCISVSVTRGENQEYLVNYCYNRRKDGDLVYAEGNRILDIRDGILNYIGEEEKISRYFEVKAKELAKKYFGYSEFN
jgi:hypothetical protein